MKKVFLMALTHALPTAIAMTEEGNVIATHAGSDADDAIQWLKHHNDTTKLEGYDQKIIDQGLWERYLYHDEPITILPEEFQKALKANLELKKQREQAVKEGQ